MFSKKSIKYLIWTDSESSFNSRCEGTRQSHPQWETRTSRQVEFIVHEDVVKEKLIVGT